jgi:hypothetical protein
MRCKHGTLIHFDWTDCGECREEAYDERQREEALDQQRQQTELLREINRKLEEQKRGGN